MTPAKLKAWRLRRGLTQTQAGVILGGYCLRAVQNWESGAKPIPGAVALLVPFLKDPTDVKDTHHD